MKQKNLFDAIKTFINNESVGTVFTTKQLIAAVGANEESTRWKEWNNNPFYRTHTYKAYLKRTGFVSFIKKGVWKIEKHIPKSYNLGTIEFLLGYKGKTYNGMTREEILNPQSLFNVKDVVELKDNNAMGAKKGATAKIIMVDGNDIGVIWLDDLSFGQRNGLYNSERFTKIKEEASQKEDRIFEENKKVMKFNFEEGKQRVIAIMSERVDDFTHDMLQDIRSVINEDRDETLDQIEEIIESIRFTKREVESATELVKSATSIQRVLEAMEETMFEGMEETVLGELFNVDIVID
jgi:predicted DNA-binding antitoxin AbrB/MazE fold protein